MLASNTSTIPISELANGWNVRKTSAECTFLTRYTGCVGRNYSRREKLRRNHRESRRWASKMGKTPIVVNDCPGFFVTACCSPTSRVSASCCATARFPQDRQSDGKTVWLAYGSGILLDVVGIDTAHHAQAVMAAASRSGCRKITAMPSTRCLMPPLWSEERPRFLAL